ncbi:MAG: cobalamin-dependent protein [Clostridiales bacterium]|nr:cobalamin-dependent protein [Clostridiales bacterium]MCL1983200.1 cobalamin-dependent protein [Clostridiales bacterium]
MNGGRVASKPELYKIARDAVVYANEEQAFNLINEVAAQGGDLLALLKEGFGKGHQEVGDMFEKGDISLPELLFSTDVTRKAVEMIENHAEAGLKKAEGKVLLATVSGDVHNIGKGLVAYTIITHGIEVIDLGCDVPVEYIIAKAEENRVDIIGTSALLTSTLREQKKLEDELRKAGIRSKYLTMVGGATCTQRWASRIGADVYCEDAVEAAKAVIAHLSKKYG